MNKKERVLLYKSGFIEKDEKAVLRRIQKEIKIPHIYNALFILTDACNFRCKYCYIETPEFLKNRHFQFMSIDVAKRACDLFIKNYDHHFGKGSVTFYGGEPLLNKSTLFYALKYFEENKNCLRSDQKLRPNIVTNGSLLDDNTINKIFEYDVRTSVSIDGPKEIHDLVRIYPSGEGTYNDVIKNYYKLKKTGTKHIYISITVGSHNINQLKEICEFIATDLEPRGVKFNFVSPINKYGNPYSFDIKANIDKIIGAFEVLRDYGIFEDTIGRKLEFFMEGHAILNSTPANGSQITLFPDGSIGPCEGLPELSIPLKEVKNLESIQLFKEWNEISVFDKPKCINCPAIALCGGGRPSDAFIKTGSLLSPDSNSCGYMPAVLEWLIWSYPKRAGWFSNKSIQK
jgi:radical SAM protein with 4Fe4S-binding SPASM domain